MKNYIELTDAKMVRVYDNQGQFIAIYKFDKEKYSSASFIIKLPISKNFSLKDRNISSLGNI